MAESNIIKKSALSPTVLIVGGAGFIGSHLSEALLKKDARVVVVDNFSTGKDIFVHNLLDNPKFALFNVDINHGMPKEIQSVDYIFQLASLESYLFDKEDLTLESLLTNALGIKNVLDFTKSCDAKLLLASTIDIYKGMISPLSLDQYFGQTPEEEKKYSLTEAKRYAEALVWEYYKRHHVDVRIARFPEVFGPRMNLESSGSLGLLIKSLVENNDLVVHGDGVERESYVYVADAVSGLIKALFSEGSKGKIYTFVGENSHTVLETTYLVKSLANAEVRVVFKPKTSYVQSNDLRVPDRSSLKELNWEERTLFKEGIIKTLSWLGYEANEHSFKPAKLVEQKQKKESVFSIVDFKKEEPPIPATTVLPVVKQAPSKPKVSPLKNLLAKFRFHRKSVPKATDYYKNLSPNLVKPASTEMPNKHSKFERLYKSAIILLALFSIFVVIVGVPILQTYVHATSGVDNLETVKADLLVLNTTAAQEHADTAFKEFYKAQDSLRKVEWLFIVVGQKAYVKDIQSLLNSAENASKAAYFLSKGAGPLSQLWQSIKPNSTEQFDSETFVESTSAFVTAQNNLRLAEAEMKQVNLARFPDRVNSYASNLSLLSENITNLVALTASLDEILGLKEKRNYLVLFQNSNELRATGGFIGSYASLTFENGKIADLLIDDVYNPDGQIDLREIKEVPPEPIKKYLQEEVLHIRNANWDPDFMVSSAAIENLFFKIDGREFDGVIAVDLYFVENLLRVTGPIYLTAYNEEINADNVYERAQFHSEFNYENGSDQKRSFLTVLGGKILEKLFSMEQNELVTVSENLVNSLDSKHLLVYMPDSSLAGFLSQKGWDGSLIQTGTSDYLYIVNSNVGGTKANFYVEPSMAYNIFSKTRDGLLRSELELTYKHTGVDNSWPGGPYTNYARVLSQRGSKLTGAKLIIDGGNPVDVFDSVVVSKSGRYNTFEFAFILDPQKTAVLNFEYDLSPDLSITKESSDYSLVWQKQPGTANDKVKFTFNSPFGTAITGTTPAMTVGANTAELSRELTTDLKLQVQLR